MDCFTQSKIGLADNWDLKKTNKGNKLQWHSSNASSPCCLVAGGCVGNLEERLHIGFICLLISPKQHRAVGDTAISTPWHHEKARDLSFSLPRSTQVSFSVGSLSFSPSLSMASCFILYWDFISKTTKGINWKLWPGYLCYFLNLYCISVGVFDIFWLAYRMPKHLR